MTRRVLMAAPIGIVALAISLGVSARHAPEAPAIDAPALESITPDRPSSYLIAAEDLLDRPEPDLATARRLLVFAAQSADTSHHAPIRSSALRALAALEPDALVAARITQLAIESDPTSAPPTWAPRNEQPSSLGSPSAATALNRLVTGRTRQYEVLIERPGVRAALEACPELAHIRRGQSLDDWADAIAAARCAECRGAGHTSDGVGATRTHAPCQTCAGDPYHALSRAERLWIFRAQLALLDPTARSWSASLTIAASRPPEPSITIDALATHYAIDRPNARWWRDGGWVDTSPAP